MDSVLGRCAYEILKYREIPSKHTVSFEDDEGDGCLPAIVCTSTTGGLYGYLLGFLEQQPEQYVTNLLNEVAPILVPLLSSTEPFDLEKRVLQGAVLGPIVLLGATYLLNRNRIDNDIDQY